MTTTMKRFFNAVSAEGKARPRQAPPLADILFMVMVMGCAFGAYLFNA